MYGVKIEVSVAMPGVCVTLSPHVLGATHDNTVFTERASLHTSMLAKQERLGELAIEDNGEGHESYERSWATLVDMGYQGSGAIVRTIQPKRKPRNDELSNDDVQRNRRVSSDRVLVEMYFGRLSQLWGIMSDTFRWIHDKYDMIATITCALTNFHTSMSPLIAQDSDYYMKVLKGYIHRGNLSI